MSLPVALCLLLHRDQVFPRLQIEPHYFLNGVYCKVMALIEYLIAGSFGGPYLSTQAEASIIRNAAECAPWPARGQQCLIRSDTNSMSGGPNLFQRQPPG